MGLHRRRNTPAGLAPSYMIVRHHRASPPRRCAGQLALRQRSPNIKAIASRFWSLAIWIFGRYINCVKRGRPISSESVVVERSALALTLRDLDPVLAGEGVTELCINRPGEAFVESAVGWQRMALPLASYEWCLRLCKLVANATQQRIDEQSPLLSASLPGGERIQVAMPPATPPHTVSITIRKPAPRTWSVEELAEKGIFERARHSGEDMDPLQRELVALLQRRDYVEFMKLAVASRR